MFFLSTLRIRNIKENLFFKGANIIERDTEHALNTQDKFKRVRENVPEIECLIAKTISWNNNKLKILDDDEAHLEEDLEALLELVKDLLLDVNLKNKNAPIHKDRGNITDNRFRKHSFVQRYNERKKNLMSNGTNI